MRRLVLGTRGSPLALWQARHVADRLGVVHSGLEVELSIIKTEGDHPTQVPLGALGGKGIFVKEIEEALLGGQIDLAVHSLKDLETDEPAGLAIAAVLERHDPRDALLSSEGFSLEDLPWGTDGATGSARRRCQLLHARPDLRMMDVRGNIDSRVRKLSEGRFGALVLALAGVERLGLSEVPRRPIPVTVCLPAVGQGALALQIRAADGRTRALVELLSDAPTETAVWAERAFLREAGGGCLAPACAYARVQDGRLHLEAMIGDPSGGRLLRDAIEGATSEGERLGERLARRLLDAGGDVILAEARRASPGGASS